MLYNIIVLESSMPFYVTCECDMWQIMWQFVTVMLTFNPKSKNEKINRNKNKNEKRNRNNLSSLSSTLTNTRV